MDTIYSNDAVKRLSAVLETVFRSCPDLSSLESQGKLSLVLLRRAGNVCTLLHELRFDNCGDNLSYLQSVLDHLPFLPPNATSLGIRSLRDILPDM